MATIEPERLAWGDFIDTRFRWPQSQHVSLVGPTGKGKTYLARAILPLRDYVTVLGTKPEDPELSAFVRGGYQRIRAWPPHALNNRAILWPKFKGAHDIPGQRETFSHAITEVFGKGGRWCFYIDEATYFSDMLKLGDELKLVWRQGRALKMPLVAACQRPAWVPREMFSEATHIFAFRITDARDIKTIAGMGSLDARAVTQTIHQLQGHEVLYLNTEDGTMIVTEVE